MTRKDGSERRHLQWLIVLLLLLVLGGFAVVYFRPIALFHEKQVAVPHARVAPRADAEEAMWSAAVASGDPVQVKAYLDKYPHGKFAEDARAILAMRSKRPSSGSSVVPQRPPEEPREEEAQPGPPAQRSCGEVPAKAVVPSPDVLSDKSTDEAYEFVRGALNDIKAYQRDLAAFRECLQMRVQTDKDFLADAAGDPDRAASIKQDMDALTADYDKTIEEEVEVVDDFTALRKAWCAKGTALKGCPQTSANED